MLVRRLEELDRSSIGFPEQLDELLHDRKWVESLKLLSEEESCELIDYLDNILGEMDPTGEPSRKCLLVLQEICSRRMILPSTYEVSGELAFSSTLPNAYGGSCDVYKGYLGPDNVCIKRLRITTRTDRASVKHSLCREAVVCKRLNHPNIASFIGVTFEPLQLVSKWIPGKELREYVSNNRCSNLVQLLLGIAEGLGYLHSHHIIHGDLKGANILVDATGLAGIVDFGLSTIARDSKSLVAPTKACWVTPRFTAPEILSGAGFHSKESDVFAFGMVVIEAFTGNAPFGDCIDAVAVMNIMTGVRPERPTNPNFTDDLWKLTQWCWEEKPQDRPRIDSLIYRLSVSSSTSRRTPPPTENCREAYKAPQPISMQTSGPHERETSQASQSAMAPPLPEFGHTTLLLLFPPFPWLPTNLFGRDSTLEALLGLAERFASFTLVGAGGMGKTAIAVTLLRHGQIAEKFGKHRYFIHCDRVKNSLDSFLERLSEAIGARFKDVAQLWSYLEGSPCILVLDGVDSILDPRASGAAEITKAIGELGRRPKVCILATSRMDIKIANFFPMEVSTLPVEAARDVFHSYCRLGELDEVDDLLEELDFHPLSITLLACAVNENGWDTPALFDAWDNDQTKILKASGRQSLEDMIESTLRAPTIQKLGPTARQTLEAIAVFEEGVEEIQLFKEFPSIDQIGSAVSALCKFSLMYRQEGFVKMFSPFRLYFQDTAQSPVSPPGSDSLYGSAAEDDPHIPRVLATEPAQPVRFGDGNAKLRLRPFSRLFAALSPRQAEVDPTGEVPKLRSTSKPPTESHRHENLHTSSVSSAVAEIVTESKRQSNQELIDRIDKILENTVHDHDRRQLLNTLCKTCSRLRSIPKAMHIDVRPDGDFIEEYECNSTTVFRGDHNGRPVAIKMLRLFSNRNLDKCVRKFFQEAVAWRHLRHPNILPLLGMTVDPARCKFAMVSEWMGHGNINEFVRISEGINRVQLLVEATSGLEYMHSFDMVHGDLKGANILINNSGRACLADFGLSTIVGVGHRPAIGLPYAPSKESLMSFTPGGTTRWMSPELLYPEKFECPDGRPTKQSDCYALGMVVYEVLCGKPPYWEISNEWMVMHHAMEGERPQKPEPKESLGFTDGLWDTIEQCWSVDIRARPDVRTVLSHLNHATWSWERRKLV